MKQRLFVALCLLALAGLLPCTNFAVAGADKAQTQPNESSSAPTATIKNKTDKQAEQPASGGAHVVLPAGPKTPLPDGNARLNQLLRLWGVFGSNIDTTCGRLHVGDLYCLAGRGTLATLARFNRPAILLLKRGGHRQQVLLNQLDETHATLVGAEGARRISRQRLTDLWTGRFEVIWRSDVGAKLVHRGMRGDAVVWLRRRLALVAADEGVNEQQPVSSYFGVGLESRVRNFQLMNGLKPDGLVGPRTQIMLNSMILDGSVPTLVPRPEG